MANSEIILRSLFFSLPFLYIGLEFSGTQCNRFLGELIIASDEVIKPGSDLLGVTMDPHSVAIDQDIAFGFDAAAEIPQFQAPAAVEKQDIDPKAPDLELCKLAADGSLGAFELIYERYHRRTYSLCLRMTSSQT